MVVVRIWSGSWDLFVHTVLLPATCTPSLVQTSDTYIYPMVYKLIYQVKLFSYDNIYAYINNIVLYCAHTKYILIYM